MINGWLVGDAVRAMSYTTHDWEWLESHLFMVKLGMVIIVLPALVHWYNYSIKIYETPQTPWWNVWHEIIIRECVYSWCSWLFSAHLESDLAKWTCVNFVSSQIHPLSSWRDLLVLGIGNEGMGWLFIAIHRFIMIHSYRPLSHSLLSSPVSP